MAVWRARNCTVASGLVIWRGQFLFFHRLCHAIVFAGPFAQIDQLAAFAAERSKAVVGVPLMFLAAMRAGHDRWLVGRHDQERLQKVRSKGTSCSNSVDFAA